MTPSQTSAIAGVLDADRRIAYGLVFGSVARGEGHARSDLAVAIELDPGAGLDALEIGKLVSDLEQASGRTVDLVLLHESPPALAYRVFRDGQVVFVRDKPAMVARRVKAILDYLDFRPFEEAFVKGVLRARG